MRQNDEEGTQNIQNLKCHDKSVGPTLGVMALVCEGCALRLSTENRLSL